MTDHKEPVFLVNLPYYPNADLMRRLTSALESDREFALLAQLILCFEEALAFQSHIDSFIEREKKRCSEIAMRVATALENDPNKYAKTVALKIARDILEGDQ